MWIYFLFIVGFIILIKGADYLVEGASAIAKRFGLSPLFIGLTIVSLGTSAPELFVNVTASIEGSAGIIIGNILGSNIANILLILGISAMVYPLTVHKNTIRKEIPFSLLAVLMVGILANDKIIDGANFNFLSRSEGLALISFFIIFIYYVFGIMKTEKQELDIKDRGIFSSSLMIIGGLIGLALGSQFIVDGGMAIAHLFSLSEAFIGLTIIAVGTSLPELAASAAAAYKKKVDIAIGNVVGSNIFNIFLVLGVSSTISPIEFSPILNTDILITIAVTVLLVLSMFIGKKQILQRWQGGAFVTLYVLYIAFLIYRG
ncbi:MAG: calcium/sodium antiporter [Candidatus Falkowbacteria bacterium]